MRPGERGRTGNGPAPLALSGTVLLLGLVVGLGCARPGADAGGGAPTPTGVVRPTPAGSPSRSPYRCPPAPSAARVTPAPPAGTRSPGPMPDISLGATTRPPTEQELAEQFHRNEEANEGFRTRGRLGDAAAADAAGCAIRVRAELDRLRRLGRYDVTSLTEALGRTRLTQVEVRPPGRLDPAGGAGLLFAGWTGHACVFGSHGRPASTVEIGTPIRDGGCLPAPD
ncbi:hypothetical protein C6W10_30185 [Plantactinospora sp. BB1]|nr:hypothetical protein C6W10_30185 [Plantactinospora sp. BB1]